LEVISSLFLGGLIQDLVDQVVDLFVSEPVLALLGAVLSCRLCRKTPSRMTPRKLVRRLVVGTLQTSC
jgi:hypothetical protein